MPTRQLAAIMFTDMVGYTALMQQNEQLAIQKREHSKKIFEESLAKHDGKLLQYYGDGTMSIFSSAVNAVRSAIEMQTLFLAEPKVDVRIGLHIGDVMFDDNGIYGDSVNVASRIESLATPGGVFISEKLFDEVKNNEGISTKSLGYFELKNVKQPMQVYAITNPGIVIPSREDLRGKTKTVLNGIAVLPFASLSSDPENEFFCDGMTEELINVLAKVNGLQVTSRTSAFAFKGKNEDVREIAAKLNVQKIIEGSVRKAGNKIRVTVQLINASDGNHFWSETYDRNLEDIFEIQDDIARAIANKLRENLTTEQHQTQLAKAPTQNLEAYKKYLQAIHFYNSALAENRNRALELLKDVIRLDPNMADAYAYLSFAYTFMSQSGQMDAIKAAELASGYALQAMKIDPENSTALVAMSFLKLHAWEWEECKRLLQQAIEINPNDALARQMNVELNLVFLQVDEALENAKLMRELDPLSATMVGHSARYSMFLGRFDEAIGYSQEALALDPQSMVARTVNASSTGFLSDWQETLERILEIHKVAGDYPFVLMIIGIAYSKLNQQEKANEIIAKFEKMMQENPNANLDFAIAFVALSNLNLEKFYEAYDRGLEKKTLLLLQCYGTELMKPVWYDEHVIESRKKLGLPVMSREP